MINQWIDKKPGERGMAILTEAFRKQNPRFDKPSNRADEFYVVLVQ